jgi:hypothetical protein
MDIRFWIWLIIIVATILSRVMKKSAQRRNSSPQQPAPDSEYDRSPGKSLTFEELLREIQESKTPSKPIVAEKRGEPQQPSKPIKSYELDYDDDIKEEQQNRSYEIYEKAKAEAFHRPSLEETMKLEDTVMKYSHFKEYDDTSQKTLAREILRDFKDPEGFRKAFIMSEILKRKF